MRLADDSLKELATELRLSSDELQAFEALSTKSRDGLLQMIQQAKRKQRDDLEVAVTSALNHIPRLLRGPVSKILGRR